MKFYLNRYYRKTRRIVCTSKYPLPDSYYTCRDDRGLSMTTHQELTLALMS